MKAKIAQLLQPMARSTQGLTYDPDNARKHNVKNMEAIKGSLKRFGQLKPIIITKAGVVLAGNGTLAAAKSLGWSKIAAAIFTGTAEEARAFALADNRTGELSAWDMPKLQASLQMLPTSIHKMLDFKPFEISIMDSKLGGSGVELVPKPRKAKTPHAEPGEAKQASRLIHTCPNCKHRFGAVRKAKP